jgi:MFS family permease
LGENIIMDKGEVLNVKKNVFWMGMTSLFTDISSEMIYPILPIFLTSTLGISKAFIGVIEGIAESTASILKIFSGWFSDKFKKRKPPVVWGYTFSAISKPLLALSSSGLHVLFLRFFDRVGKGIRTSPRDALISESTPKEKIGAAFGFHRAMDTLGAVIGPLLAFLLLPMLGGDVRPIFLISFIPAALAVALLWFFVKEKSSQPTAQSPELKFSLAPFNMKFKFFVFIVFLFTLGNSSNAFLILRAQGVGVAVFLIPILWLMFNSVYSLTAMPAGILSDKIGRKKVIIGGYIIYSLVYFGLAYVNSPVLVWLLFAFYGIHYGLTDGTERAFISDISPKEYKATAFGVYHAAVGFALLPASVIMGVLWQSVGPTVAFSFGGVLAGIAAVLLLFV